MPLRDLHQFSFFLRDSKLKRKCFTQFYFSKKLSWEFGIKWIMSATLFKEKLQYRCFLVNIEKYLRTSFLQNISGRLLLHGKSHTSLSLQKPISLISSFYFKLKMVVLHNQKDFRYFKKCLLLFL